MIGWREPRRSERSCLVSGTVPCDEWHRIRRPGPDRLLTSQEAAELLGLPERTVRHLARTGKIPAARFGRQYRFRRDLLLELASRPLPPDDDVEENQPDT